ncbi:hypothetical protein AK812_SmicGene8321 [Symbiodinium microadriaticum]|uniref:Uncharacterized protein n=1 Tax=Symbiodinium microadriaticum TaxID=2951 RepID=A0A1Q9EL97_SYMMI|nr:hypothetical protein AK812_SmicGene8321 [Symbiodinium microadriaticum]
MSWRLTAYGVANAVAGEALSSIVEADGVTAAASLPDERYDLVSLLEREVGGKRYLAVAQGRVFNPTAAAVAAAPLNGHKTQHRDLHEAPGGPPGAVREARVLNMLSADHQQRTSGLSKEQFTRVMTWLADQGVMWSTVCKVRLGQSG